MKQKVKIGPGDIVAIPLGEKEVAVGIVLHVSAIFRSAVMMGFYDQIFSSIEEVNVTSLKGRFIDVANYVGKQLITSGRWKIVGYSSDLLAAAEIPELRAANAIYLRDQVLRQVAFEDFGKYTELIGQGGLFVENKLRAHFGLSCNCSGS